MARFYRKRKGFSRSYRRRMSPYRSWRGSVYRAQSSGTRRFSVAIPVSSQVNIPIVDGTLFSQVFSFFPFASYTDASGTLRIQSCLGNCFMNNLYYTYCGLYDEVKLNAFSLRLSVLSVPVDGKGSFIETALDRHGNPNDLSNVRSHADIQNSSEVVNNQFTSLERASIYRYYRARDLGERTYFMDSSNVDIVDRVNDPPQWGRRQNEDWGTGAGCFTPLLSGYIRLLSTPVNGSSVLISYNVVWYLTFRNPKASVGAANRSLNMSDMKADVGKSVDVDVLPDVEDDDVKKGSKKFDELSDEEKSKIMELIGSMGD